jgi:hypothetical protein
VSYGGEIGRYFGAIAFWEWDSAKTKNLKYRRKTAIALSFPDLGKLGNMGMILVGSEPTLRGLEVAGSRVPLFDTDNVWYVEVAYRYQLNDRIRIIPGLIWLPALNQNEGNDDVFK